MPALVAIFVITSVTSLLVFPRDLLLDFAESQLASALYVSNIYFWSVADYFDTSSYLKPLLHTWSLSVEEQFYLVWPLCLFLIGVRRSRWFIAIAGTCSLIAAEMMYGISATTTFFMFPFRIFEFAIGAWISVASIKNISARQGYSFLGIAILMLIGSIFLGDERARMPGVLSLPVCVATALIISINHPWLNRQDLLTRIFLRVGLISYSAYLVHWPLVVFYKILVVDELRWMDSLLLLIITLILAELLYRLIEVPFGRFRLAGKQRFYFGLLVLLIALAWSYMWLAPKIYDIRRDQNLTVSAVIDNTPRRKQEVLDAAMRAVDMKLMSKAPIQILVVGDSHSIDARLALIANLDVSQIGVSILHSICDPLTLNSIGDDFDTLYHEHPNASLDRDKCVIYNRDLANVIANINPDILIFSEHWREEALPFLTETLEEIKTTFSGRVLILGPNFSFRQDPLIWMKKNVASVSQLNKKSMEIALDLSHIDSELAAIALQTNVSFISKFDLVCPQRNCDFLLEDQLSYSDTSHWSMEGMKFFGARLVEHSIFKKLVAEIEEAKIF
jgi:peptidoglycan/LPS O-acetylase OafA/YrhL